MSNSMKEISALAASYRRDGAIHLPAVLDEATLQEAERCFNWSRANPTPSACSFYDTDDGIFYQDLCHPQAAHAYRKLLETSPLADIAAALWGSDEVWFLYEQVFLKEGTARRRTPWHQDSPYLALDGDDIAVMWINFDPVKKEQSLEFVRGSHRQTIFDGSAFDPHDDTKPIYGSGLPRLPAIEADRSAWDIVSWAISPGDIVVFHPSTLHGGAPTRDSVGRRTLSLRFFGGDAVYAKRPTPAPAPLVAGLHDSLTAGQTFRHPAFPRLRPTSAGFDEIPKVRDHSVSIKSQMQNDPATP